VEVDKVEEAELEVELEVIVLLFLAEQNYN
jgi:hypothetical protein